MATEKGVSFETAIKKSSTTRTKLLIILGFLALVLLFVSTFQFLFLTSFTDKEKAELFEGEVSVLDSVLVFQHGSGYMRLKNPKTEACLEGELGQSLKSRALVKNEIENHCLLIEWSNYATLNVSKDGDRCFHVNWKPKGIGEPRYFLDCFELGDSHWYGGSELYRQEWPLEKADIQMMPYLPSDTILGISRGQILYGDIIERYWFTSNGMAILVDESVPLHVSVNASGDKKLCLKADPDSYPTSIASLQLTYKICVGADVKDIHQFMMKEFFQYPAGIPDERMIKQPVWSTWAQFSKGVNQTQVLSYAAKIKDSGFSYSHIEIDDMYSTFYGDFDFDPIKFPHPKAMINSLHSDGFRVTIWVYPFANTDSRAFQEGMQYWVRDKGGVVPGLVHWWNGIAATVDTTNIQAAEWFRNGLKAFVDFYQIDGLKFDAGGLTYLPACYHLHSLANNNPDIYSMKYAEIASSLGLLNEVRVGHQTQELPLFVRMLDRSSTWDENNGLRSVIPTTLTFGVLGYPFVLPDMIGGNGFCLTENGTLILQCGRPNDELFIRWVQANAFLPSMQFSFAPWDLNEETVRATRKILQLREQLADYLVSCAKQATTTGAPIVRPLWWLVPGDPVAQEIYTEFMLGESYLIAPVLTPMDENKGKHSVYLPEGVWREQFAGEKVMSVKSQGLWLEYDVSLEDLPFFLLLAGPADKVEL